jgi:hypothetical protein
MSQMIGASSVLGQFERVVRFCAILHLKKPLFLPREQRLEEDFIRTLCEYDVPGLKSDLIIQERILNHWEE